MNQVHQKTSNPDKEVEKKEKNILRDKLGIKNISNLQKTRKRNGKVEMLFVKVCYNCLCEYKSKKRNSLGCCKNCNRMISLRIKQNKPLFNLEYTNYVLPKEL